MDCVASAGARGTGYAPRRMGAGEFADIFGWETRVMRGTYGPDQPYENGGTSAQAVGEVRAAVEAAVLHRTGVLWMVSGQDHAFESESVKALRAAKIKFQELSASQMKKRWSQINFEGIEWGIFEPECGYLDARASCQAVVEAFVAAGGKYRQAAVLVDGLESAPLRLALTDDSHLKADYYVFACGPWLGRLFPRAVGELVQPTKQDIFFFGTPSGDDRFRDAHLPVWGDHRGRFRYGIPGATVAGSRSPTTHADRRSIRPMASAWSIRKR